MIKKHYVTVTMALFLTTTSAYGHPVASVAATVFGVYEVGKLVVNSISSVADNTHRDLNGMSPFAMDLDSQSKQVDFEDYVYSIQPSQFGYSFNLLDFQIVASPTSKHMIKSGYQNPPTSGDQNGFFSYEYVSQVASSKTADLPWNIKTKWLLLHNGLGSPQYSVAGEGFLKLNTMASVQPTPWAALYIGLNQPLLYSNFQTTPITTVWTQYLNQPNAYLGIEVKDRTENIGLSVDYSISRGSVSAAIVFGNVPITMVSDSLSGLRFHSSFGEF